MLYGGLLLAGIDEAPSNLKCHFVNKVPRSTDWENILPVSR